MIVQTLLFCVIIHLLHCANADYDVRKYCQLTQPGVKLPSLDSCQEYYMCLGNDMFITQSCPKGEAFDRDNQRCVNELASNCYFGVTNPCQNKDKAFAHCSNGCNWYNWCVDGKIAGNGTCMIGQRFYAPNGTCIFGQCDNTKRSDMEDMCEIMPEGIFFGDFEDCRAWYKCESLNEQSGLCLNGLVFDAYTGQCLENKDNMCERTKNVVQSVASGPPETPCTSVSEVVADTNVCSIYYTCEANQNPAVPFRWVQKKCKNQYFDVITNTCNGTLAARPYPGCDRCQFKAGTAQTYWTNAVDPLCEQYFTCTNGQKIGSDLRSCTHDSFFNENSQSCNGIELEYDQYVENNGACQDYTCTDDRVCKLVGAEETVPQPPIGETTDQDKGKQEPSTDTDAGKQDAGKQDAGKQDAGNQDAGKQDAGKQDAGKQDAGKQDAGKQGSIDNGAAQSK